MTASSNQRVVITGVGLITPFANNREDSWSAIRSGATATRWLDAPLANSSAAGTRAGAPVLLAEDGTDQVVRMATHAAHEAIADSALNFDLCDRNRVGCVVGTSKGLLDEYKQRFELERTRAGEPCPDSASMSRVRPLDLRSSVWPGLQPSFPSVAVAREFQLGGPMLCPIAACATGLQSLSRGVDLIRNGHCDVVIAGSSDASVRDWVLCSFQRLGVLAKNFEDPANAVRPFDANRNGFLVGEGAAIMVLEKESQAVARGANIWAEWIASISAADTTGMTQIDETGETLSEVLRRLLKLADLSSEDIDHANLHGTATTPNDRAEANAIASIFGMELPCSSLKGAIGHLLGAAGSVETAISLLAMRDDVVPPTANFETPDTPPVGVAVEARKRNLSRILKTSLGFGGHISAAVLARH